jgi:hypothetical protein
MEFQARHKLLLRLVGKTAFHNRNPAENYSHRATRQSNEEHDLKQVHDEHLEFEDHGWTLLFSAANYAQIVARPALNFPLTARLLDRSPSEK